jgi:hypothetical protein
MPQRGCSRHAARIAGRLTSEVWAFETPLKKRFNGSCNRIDALFAGVTSSCSDGSRPPGTRHRIRKIYMER